MWLYVPSTSISCPSALEAQGSISESNWRFQALAQSAWWRGKPSPSRTWFQRCNKVSFIKRLCGAMSEPSTADAGVAAWTASLAAFRASHTALQEESREVSMNAISGNQLGVSSSSQVSGSSSSKMSEACSRPGLTKSLAPSGFGETFSSLVSRLRSDCSRRRKSARAMSASVSSSSAWPTASADFLTGDDPDLFRARAARLKEKHKGKTGNGAGMTLATAANAFTLWPTPATRDHKGTNSADHLENGTGRKHLDQLPNFVEHLWYTPNVPNGGRALGDDTSATGMTPDGAKRQVGLEKGSSGGVNRVSSLRNEARCFPLDPEVSMNGNRSSNERRSLNPRFVEWLMGWPEGWTHFACSAMELFRFKQRMRSALWQLALPAEAPPAQLALFG